MRTREGMAVARAKGRLRGRQPKLSAKQQAELRRMHASESGTNWGRRLQLTDGSGWPYLPPRPPVVTAACPGRALLRTARQPVLSWALGVTLAGMREQAVQVVVDDGLGLFERGLAGQDAVAQARRHGEQAECLRVRV